MSITSKQLQYLEYMLGKLLCDNGRLMESDEETFPELKGYTLEGVMMKVRRQDLNTLKASTLIQELQLNDLTMLNIILKN